MTYGKTTPGGIARPQTGPFVTFPHARTIARKRNEAKGRGYRALRAQDGSAVVIFRPAVANNRQRKVRALDA